MVKSHRNIRIAPDWPLALCQKTKTGAMDSYVLGGSREVGIVDTGRVLHAHRDPIVAESTLSKVVRLEVERGLGEAVSVRNVVDRVHDEECVRDCRVDVRRGGRSHGRILGVDEVESSGGLGRSDAGFSSDDVVSTKLQYRNVRVLEWKPGGKK